MFVLEKGFMYEKKAVVAEMVCTVYLVNSYFGK